MDSMDRNKYRSVMTSLSIGLIAAAFFYIQTEIRLNRALESIREVVCMENMHGPDKPCREEKTVYAAVGKAMEKKSCAAAQAACIPEGKEN